VSQVFLPPLPSYLTSRLRRNRCDARGHEGSSRKTLASPKFYPNWIKLKASRRRAKTSKVGFALARVEGRSHRVGPRSDPIIKRRLDRGELEVTQSGPTIRAAAGCRGGRG
jgi:hypothetical protein